MKLDDGNLKGDLHPLQFDKIEEGKRSGPLSAMPFPFREKFHRSISDFIQNHLPKDKLDGDWNFNINDTDEGLNYQLYYKKDAPDGNYMVITRVGTYNLEKKEMLPSDQDKIMVFRFTNVDKLLL